MKAVPIIERGKHNLNLVTYWIDGDSIFARNYFCAFDLSLYWGNGGLMFSLCLMGFEIRYHTGDRLRFE